MSKEAMHIDWEKVGQYVYQGEDGTLIADILGIHPETLYNRCKDDNNIGWTEWCRSKRSKGKNALRAKMFMKAMGDKNNPLSGDVKCLLHLSKHMRGEWDKLDIASMETASGIQAHIDNEEMEEKYRLRKEIEELKAKLEDKPKTGSELCGVNTPL